MHRTHWYEYVEGKLVHVPFAAVKVFPAREVPDTVGAAELAGANNAATPAAVEIDQRVEEPFAFVAITAATMNLATSDDVNV